MYPLFTLKLAKMCGICGFSWPDSEQIEQMVESLDHRGPDDRGTFVNQELSLGHTRLSIIDLSHKAKQPLSYQDLTITYNGEIYNYKELREELSKLGHKFETKSDTEVILAAYKEWGSSSINKLYGMWAFAIYDKTKKELFISRDRFGQKPLYYYQNPSNGSLIFASEIKAILKHD